MESTRASVFVLQLETLGLKSSVCRCTTLMQKLTTISRVCSAFSEIFPVCVFFFFKLTVELFVDCPIWWYMCNCDNWSDAEESQPSINQI